MNRGLVTLHTNISVHPEITFDSTVTNEVDLTVSVHECSCEFTLTLVVTGE